MIAGLLGIAATSTPLRSRPGSPLHGIALLIATWFGIGLIPLAPGTWGALAALPIGWMIRGRWGAPGLAAAFAAVFVGGCWAAGAVANASGVQDPGAVVVDEVAGLWLVLLAAPPEPSAWALAFLLFRLFDIWKPWPVRWADLRVRGGFGIMLDDILAAGYAFAVLAAVLAIAGAVRVRI
ncbi:MAG TPA: phosphatidylglycerophosphatase A [Stellaceae bacterium]|nr:phosphatidylglycerophosphatase A [Stellaceae bacterium]